MVLTYGGNMMFSPLKGVDFFEKALKKGGKITLVLCIQQGYHLYPRSQQMGLTLKFWYKHRYPQIWGMRGAGALFPNISS
jgi:hypothetical protein